MRSLTFIITFFAMIGCAGVRADPAAPSAQARWIVKQLDGMGVESKWNAGEHVDWETGLADGKPASLVGRHTHCSAFVAAAAERLGVYILRPPEHGQELLANAQNEWLAAEGAGFGWRRVSGPVEAETLANKGFLVVASYHNHHDDKPGHIAIVLPGAKDTSTLAQEGPDVIQAATRNSQSISLRDGFAGHPHAWEDQEIVFYAHKVAARAAP